MNNTINSDLIRGNIDTIILRALYGGDRYGYDIIKEIEQRSSGKYKLKQPTLYSCLNRLENQGFIRSYWGTKSIGGRRKYYTLTDMGKELFIRNKTDWEYSKSLIDNLITDESEKTFYEYDSNNESGVDNNKAYFDLNDEESAYTMGDEDDTVYAVEDSDSDEDEEDMDKEDSDSDEEDIDKEDSDSDDDDEDERITDGDDEEETDYSEKTTYAADKYITDRYTVDRYVTEAFVVENQEVTNSVTEENVASEAVAGDSRIESEGHSESESNQTETESEPYQELDEREYMRMVENLLRNNDSNNYTNKLQYEKYTPDKNIYTDEHLRTENYFKDFDDIEDEDDGEDEEYQENDGFEEEQIPMQISAPAPKPAVIFHSPHKEHEKKSSDTFLSYRTDPKTIVSAQKTDGTQSREDIYKIFEAKLAGIKKPTETQPEKESAYVSPISEEQIAQKEEPEFFRKDQIQIRNFKRLQDSAADMGEEIKIRSYESASAREFNEQYYFYSNKLKLRQYFMLFCFILAEVILCYIIINLGLRKSVTVPTSDLLIYIFAVLTALIFPTSAFLHNWSNPNKRKRVSYSFTMQMIFSIIVTVQLILIVYFLNVYFDMPLSIDSGHYTSLIVPIVMCLNIPINTVIFNVLFKSKKYSV